jgi:hypothetical protein
MAGLDILGFAFKARAEHEMKIKYIKMEHKNLQNLTLFVVVHSDRL